jgi:hypothetical protein
VSVGEAFVQYDVNGNGSWDAGDEVREVSFSGLVEAPKAGDPVQLPNLDASKVNPRILSWSSVDETGKSPGWIVRHVEGASVAVRVLWNPQKFTLGSDTVANMNTYDKWAANWRRSTTETFLQKGETQ